MKPAAVTAIAILLTLTLALPAAAAETSYQVAAAHDDAYEYQGDGDVFWQLYQLQIDGGTFAAIRYALGVPTGTTASDARITITANGSTNACSHMPIRLEATDNAADYENGDTIWNRTYTTDAIVATVPPMAADGDTWTSPNIAPLINEIISRPGWIPGQYIAIVLGPCAISTDITELHSYDTDPDSAPQLTIDWTEPTAVGLYSIMLPSGQLGLVEMRASFGELAVIIAAAALALLTLWAQLRQAAWLISKRSSTK